MIIYWENIWGSLIVLGEGNTWRLYADLDDDQADAYIYLEIDGQRYETLWSNELTQGRENTGLDSYHIVELYSAVVRKAYEMLHMKKVRFLNLTEIQNQLLEEYWGYWKARGVVSEEHW